MNGEMEIIELAEVSYINLVIHYEADLKRVLEGENPTDIFTDNVRSRLREKGVLGFLQRQWFVTRRAREYILEKDELDIVPSKR